MKYHYIFVNQTRYGTSNVAKYLYTATFKASTKLYKTTLPYDMIFAKYDTSTSDEQVEKLTREFNIHYIDCIGSLIYLLSKKVDLSFAAQVSRFSENPGKVHIEGLVHILRYIRDNKTLGLKYYTVVNDAPVTDLLRKDSIKTENQFMVFLILVGKIVQTLAEVQEHTLFLIKAGQFTMAHMFQDQLINQMQKVSTM